MRNPSSSTTSTAKAKAGGGSTTTSKTPCCSKIGMKRGPWTPEEDELLSKYIKREGEGRWRTLPKRAGLLRCGKSCRLRWMNYLRPSVKRGHIAPDEEDLILRLHRLLGNRWSLIAGRIPGRTDNEIKNYWNTHLSKKLISQGIDPRTHKPLDPNSDDKQAASKKAVPNPNSALEETVLVTGRLNIVSNNKGNNEQYQYQCEGGLNLQSSDDGMGLSSGHGNNNINEDNNNNYCTDDVFSSFLNSLINEDVFNSQQIVLHQPPPEDDPLISSNSLQSITFAPHGGDAPALLHQNNDPKMFNGHVENHF